MTIALIIGGVILLLLVIWLIRRSRNRSYSSSDSGSSFIGELIEGIIDALTPGSW